SECLPCAGSFLTRRSSRHGAWREHSLPAAPVHRGKWRHSCAVTLDLGSDALYRRYGGGVILREIETDTVAGMRTELCARCDNHARLQPQDLDEVSVGNRKFRQARKKIASGLRGTGKHSFHL